MAGVYTPQAVRALETPGPSGGGNGRVKRGKARIDLGDVEVCSLVVLPNDAGAENDYRERYAQATEDEGREF